MSTLSPVARSNVPLAVTDPPSLNLLRQRKGVTLGRLAEMTGLTEATVSRAFLGRRTSAKTLSLLYTTLQGIPDLAGAELLGQYVEEKGA